MSLTEGNITMRKIILSLFITMILGFSSILVAAQESDPLPSWSNGPTKSAIMQFVRDVTESGGTQYVRPEERIATFDNDGTLWSEQPVVQLEWKDQAPYKAILEGDKGYLVNDYLNNHGKGMHELVVALTS